MGVFTLSLVKSPAICGDDDQVNAQDYSVVMLTRTVGTFIGIPMMTAAWSNGIGIGGAALGAPYFLSSVSIWSSSLMKEIDFAGILCNGLSNYPQVAI
jgi:hypothetical protein